MLEVTSVCTPQSKQLNWSLPGRLCIGAIAPMMVSAPLVRPEAPRPATALPTINMFEDRAAPQMVDPISKRPRKAMKVFWQLLVHNPRVPEHAYLGTEVRVDLSSRWLKSTANCSVSNISLTM